MNCTKVVKCGVVNIVDFCKAPFSAFAVENFCDVIECICLFGNKYYLYDHLCVTFVTHR